MLRAAPLLLLSPFPHRRCRDPHVCARRPVRRVALERRPKPLLGSGTKTATDVSTDTGKGYVSHDDVVALEMQQSKGGNPLLTHVREGTSSLGGGACNWGCRRGDASEILHGVWYHLSNRIKQSRANNKAQAYNSSMKMRGTITPVRIWAVRRGSPQAWPWRLGGACRGELRAAAHVCYPRPACWYHLGNINKMN